MLVISRKINDRIVIGGNIVLTVLELRPGQVRLGIEAPIDRGEVHREKQRALENHNATR